MDRHAGPVGRRKPAVAHFGKVTRAYGAGPLTRDGALKER
jgi:hypothetical protein